ncbi:hypothetical protein [Rhodoferax sp.]|uniref:hypothetical protein n=1 Tax=Rhodoferax sp. TaxID=50421 RepID=UPI001ED740B1|nr:hypothetical protein [Rhodoferax sp.]MBT9507424.1 hypothetical protein [Rhodoferax sp.]
MVNQRFGHAQLRFIRHTREADWLRVTEHKGFEAAQPLIGQLCAGRVDPQQGHVVTLSA